MSRPLIICIPSRVADAHGGPGIPDAAVRWCVVCSERVYVAPSGLAQDADPVCVACAPGAVRARGYRGKGVTSGEAREELRAAGLSDREIDGTARLMTELIDGDG